MSEGGDAITIFHGGSLEIRNSILWNLHEGPEIDLQVEESESISSLNINYCLIFLFFRKQEE